jgi:glycerol-3-phosphate dehydrogenase subunit B
MIRKAFDAFREMTKKQGFEYIGSIDENQWIPTAVGTLKPSCLTSRTMDGKAFKAAKEVLVVGFDTLKDFSAKMVRKNLAKLYEGKKSIKEIIVKLGFEAGRDVNAMDVARWLDTEEGRQSFVAQVKASAGSNTVILVPPVLGTEPNYKVLDSLEKSLGAKLVEATAMPPSVTGYRLRLLLLDYAKKLGVKFIEKAKVIKADGKDGKCEYVVTEGFDRERKFYAKEFILATGGLYGGGMTSEMGKITEAVFKLPIAVPKVQTEWSNPKLFSNQKQIFAQYGVLVNDDLAPVDAEGRVLVSNLKVVGRSLAGYDFCFEKSGNGVAIATAYKAAISL